MSRHTRLALAAAATVGALVMTACGGGGASDTVGGDAENAGAKTGTINLFAYAVPKVGFDKVIPAFNKTEAGKGVAVPAVLRRLGRPVAQGRGRRRPPTS